MDTISLTERFEDHREIKNLMGKYVSSLLLHREREICDLFWSRREDICLGLNHGYYQGSQAVRNYYTATADATAVKGKVLQEIFPEQLGSLSDSELYGVGPFEAKPLTNPYIVVAGDRKTAKGIWMSAGYHIDIEPCGPVGHWCWGTFAADLVLEDGQWRLWHLLYTLDVRNIAGQDWAAPPEPLPELPEFAALKEIAIPGPNVPAEVRAIYSANRPFTKLPRVPEPYETFQETFSYGI